MKVHKYYKKLSYCRDSACWQSLCHSKSFKVTDVTNQKPVCGFLLVNNTDLILSCAIFQLWGSTG